MIEQPFLAQAHRRGQITDTRNEYPLDRTYLPPDWQEDRRSDRRMWAVIVLALVGVVVAYLMFQANRSPLYAVETPQVEGGR